MTIHYQGHGVTLHHGDCLDVLRALPDASVDSVVTDPPYGLEFMGKDWDAPWKSAANSWADRDAEDHAQPENRGQTASPFLAAKVNKFAAGLPFQQWCELWAAECLRVLKPGGHLLACAVEDAGFEVRDSIAWMYGSGFPKSLDVSKAIDKMDASTERRARALRFTEWMRSTGVTSRQIDAATDSFMGGHYLTALEQASIPTAEMFDLIRPLLHVDVDVPEWVEVLVAERTVESANYAARAVLGERTTGRGTGRGSVAYIGDSENRDVTAPATDAAREWAGWGTALKPGHEPVVCARKPFNTVPLGEEVDRLHHLIGGLLWLSLSPAKRAELASPSSPAGQHGARCASALVSAATATSPDGFAQTGMCSSPATASTSSSIASSWSSILGALSALTSTGRKGGCSDNGTMTGYGTGDDVGTWPADAGGGASRFFFVASHDKGDTSALTGKGGRIESCETASTAAESSSPPRQFGDSALGGAVTSEHPDTASQTGSPSTSATPSGSRPSGRPATPTTQNIDAESSPEQQPGERTPTASPASSVGPSAPTVTTTTTTSPSTSAGSAAPATSDTTSQWKALGDTDSAPFKYVAKADATERPRVNGTAHPTVKPLSLMRWLVRLVTPPGGTVLEPFAGSGTTVEACIVEGFDCIAIEKTDEYLPLIMQRIHRRRDPVAAIRQTGDELGLFELDGEGA